MSDNVRRAHEAERCANEIERNMRLYEKLTSCRCITLHVRDVDDNNSSLSIGRPGIITNSEMFDAMHHAICQVLINRCDELHLQLAEILSGAELV